MGPLQTQEAFFLVSPARVVNDDFESMNILVSNLSTNIIDRDLLQLFSVYGAVGYVTIIRDHKSGRSQGAAFLDMPHQSEGEQAILALNHSMLDGRVIAVEEIVYKAGEFNN